MKMLLELYIFVGHVDIFDDLKFVLGWTRAGSVLHVNSAADSVCYQRLRGCRRGQPNRGSDQDDFSLDLERLANIFIQI